VCIVINAALVMFDFSIEFFLSLVASFMPTDMLLLFWTKKGELVLLSNDSVSSSDSFSPL